MLTIIICVGSSCYVRGSDSIADTFERLIAREDLGAEVELRGTFCMEQCSMGVSVQVGDRVYRQVSPDQAESFFYREVVPQITQGVTR